jgi:hypothetical protein
MLSSAACLVLLIVMATMSCSWRAQEAARNDHVEVVRALVRYKAGVWEDDKARLPLCTLSCAVRAMSCCALCRLRGSG